MAYSKIDQWDALSKDLANLEVDEELLITFGKKQYVIRVANENDFKNHTQTTMYTDTINFFKKLRRE